MTFNLYLPANLIHNLKKYIYMATQLKRIYIGSLLYVLFLRNQGD